jgi:predicted Zn-dependent protease with MMP-like domain
MPRKHINEYTQISAQVEIELREKLAEYCDQNNIKISDLIRKALMREIGYSQDFHDASEREKMIRLIVQKEVREAIDKESQRAELNLRRVK